MTCVRKWFNDPFYQKLTEALKQKALFHFFWKSSCSLFLGNFDNWIYRLYLFVFWRFLASEKTFREPLTVTFVQAWRHAYSGDLRRPTGVFKQYFQKDDRRAAIWIWSPTNNLFLTSMAPFQLLKGYHLKLSGLWSSELVVMESRSVKEVTCSPFT